ncbi:diguanylate cyclase [Vibrio tapetis subsp. quintayensis]|uniref:sensor domain-containing diguanylate cyclase n=1 Tax=Vibrio tapetis TaxID=52443 RepID=UPI0025B3F8BC|nr:diguanylate cyclase [Vibrio tapetis]MDN3681616.1 diguanylate cyclase [Vibrio tapetis subsp. quintayensis]
MKLKNVLIYLVLACLLSGLSVATYSYYRYQNIIEQHQAQLINDSLNQLTYSKREFHDIQAQLSSTMELLGNSHYLFDYLKAPNEHNKTLVEDMWISVAGAQEWFTDIRLVTLDGKSELGVSYANDLKLTPRNESDLEIVPEAFFSFAMPTKKGQVGSWGVDLKRVNGELLRPYQPVLTVFTPVHYNGQRLGYILVNLDVWYVSTILDFSPKSEFIPEVLTTKGDYLISRQRNKLFGYLLPDRSEHNFALQRPKVWDEMLHEPSGHYFEQGSLYVFSNVEFMAGHKVYLLISFDERTLKKGMQREIDNLMHKALLTLLGMLLFAFPMTYIIHVYRKRSLESKLARAALHGMSAVMISDSRHRIIKVNKEFESMTGFENDAIVGCNALKLLMEKHKQSQLIDLATGLKNGGFWQGELSSIKASGESFTAITRIQKMVNFKLRSRYFVTSIVDISERKALEERLRHLSERDELTGCWNRRKFDSELQKQSNLVERYGNKYHSCLVLVDIDHFKRVNDQFGHDEGDRVIHKVGDVLGKQLRDTDFLARIGGEEFAIILPNTELKSLDVMLNRLRIAVEIEKTIHVTVSIGVTDIIGDTKRSYKFADIALYESKAAGRNCVSTCLSSSDVA